MAIIRQEVNIIDVVLTTAADSNAVVYLNPGVFNGSLTWFFEIVGKVTSGTATVTLHDSTDNVHATISVTETDYSLKRAEFSTSPTADTYHVNLSGGTTPSILLARIVIIQNTEANSLSLTETQIEIGNDEGTLSITYVALANPKYWLYTSANWDSISNVYFEANLVSNNKSYTAFAELEVDDGSWANWVAVTGSILSVYGLTKARVRSDAIKLIAGRHYRVGIESDNSKGIASIYNAKIIIQSGSFGAESFLEINMSGQRSIISDDTYIYVGQWFTAAMIKRILKSDFSTITTKTLDAGENDIQNITQDDNYIYGNLDVTPESTPAGAFRLSKADFSTKDSLFFGAGQFGANGIANDENYVYVGLSYTNPAQIVRINKSDFTTYITKTLDAGQSYCRGLDIDDTYLYVGLYSGQIVRILLSDFSTTSVKTIDTQVVKTIVSDDSYLYILKKSAAPQTISKLSKSDFDTVTTLTLPSTILDYTNLLAVDDSYIYISTRDTPIQVARIDKDFSTIIIKTFTEHNDAYGLHSDGTYIYTAVHTSGNRGIVKIVRDDPPNNFELQYLLLNTGDADTGLQNKKTQYNSAEWSGVTNIYKYAHDATNAADSSKLVDLPSTDIADATVTGANQQVSGEFTMVADGHQIDVNVTNSTGVVGAARIIAEVTVGSSGTNANVDAVIATISTFGVSPAITGKALISGIIGEETSLAVNPVLNVNSNVVSLTTESSVSSIIPAITGKAVIVSVITNITAESIDPSLNVNSLVNQVTAEVTIEAIPPSVSIGGDIQVLSIPAVSTIEALTPQIQLSANIAATISESVANTQVPNIVVGVNLVISVSEINIIGVAPSLIGVANVVSEIASLSCISISPTVSLGVSLLSQLGNIEISALPPTLQINNDLRPTVANIDLTTLAPIISVNINIAAVASLVSISGIIPNLTLTANMQINIAVTQINAMVAQISAKANIETQIGNTVLIANIPIIQHVTVVNAFICEATATMENVNIQAKANIEATISNADAILLNPNISSSANIDSTMGIVQIIFVAPTVLLTANILSIIADITAIGISPFGTFTFDIYRIIVSMVQRKPILTFNERFVTLSIQERLAILNAEYPMLLNVLERHLVLSYQRI